MKVVGSSVTSEAGVERGQPLVDLTVEGREEDERLEGRARLAFRSGGPVELGLVVGAAADQRENVAVARVERDQRGLSRLPAACDA